MNRPLVRWKSVACKSLAGKNILLDLPNQIDKMHGGTLLSQIISMPKQTPISFSNAINLVVEAQKDEWESGRFVRYPVFWNWHLKNFIQWLTALGYHVELSGEEFIDSIRV